MIKNSTENNTAKKNRNKKIGVICILFILFVSPFFLARWFFYDYGTDVLSALGTVNEGHLIQPPIQLDIKNITTTEGKKWTIVCVASDQVSNDVVESTLDKIQRIRLSLGKEFSETSALLILPPSYSEEIQMPTIVSEDIPEMTLPENKMAELLVFSGGEQGIFIMDSENRVLLAYSIEANSEAIYKDIRRLIKYTQGA